MFQEFNMTWCYADLDWFQDVTCLLLPEVARLALADVYVWRKDSWSQIQACLK